MLLKWWEWSLILRPSQQHEGRGIQCGEFPRNICANFVSGENQRRPLFQRRRAINSIRVGPQRGPPPITL